VLLAALPLVALGAAAVAPDGPRAAALRRLAPDGGLAWALPSEALIWEDRSGYEFLPNYDAVWLGRGGVRVAKLAGTTLSGRFSLHRPIAALREIKDEAELAALRTSARAVVEALREVRPLIRPGAREEDVASALMTAASKHGCDGGPSFPPIVTSGPRAARAHGTGNDGTLRDGELVVIDIGCFTRGYASDFTRTLAVSGRFGDRQRSLYDAVYAAQQAAVRACKPGAQLLRGPGSLNAIARDAFRARGIEPHNEFGIGHTVGLFVHDVGPTSGTLREGMVITIEPGIYLDGELGIRIEDTYVVTKDGCTPLTSGFPADLASVGG
jgi:Xaa-Pro aminopeptidase